jgi:diacylglycerol kinase family enzyme
MNASRSFDTISIIFNPNSTGDAPKLAGELQQTLKDSLHYPARIELHPTNHAGHAVELARSAADSGGKVLVVSVSGDGGYNEVVNGVMASSNPNAASAVLAAGNANDHHRTINRQPLADAILEGAVRTIDLLQISVEAGSDAHSVYAHSYIGFGLTPIVAIDLEKGGKGAFKEMFTVVRTFAKFRPFEIRQTDGKRRRFDSLVFANISQMAKYATLSEADDDASDGKFEVITFAHQAKWRVLLRALRATTKGLGDQPSMEAYEFTTLKPIPYQIDGEVRSAPAHTVVKIRSVPRALSVVG